jgi:hypothetical protein
VLAELSQRPAELYLGVIRHQTFCDDEHSIVVRGLIRIGSHEEMSQQTNRRAKNSARAVGLLGRKGRA